MELDLLIFKKICVLNVLSHDQLRLFVNCVDVIQPEEKEDTDGDRKSSNGVENVFDGHYCLKFDGAACWQNSR